MNWIDYREKLGIGFNDAKKLDAFRNNISALFDGLKDYLASQRLGVAPSFRPYFIMVGETPYYSRYDDVDSVSYSIRTESDLFSMISKCVALVNALNHSHETVYADAMKDAVLSYLDHLKIAYSIIADDDGIFIFPKGVPEFDDALVSAPLDWLKNYPKAETAWSKALRNYSVVTEDTASDVADLLRKALEAFFQEALGGSKSLENYKSEYGTFLKAHNVPAEIANNFITLLDAFTNYNNSFAKHHDKASFASKNRGMSS